MNRYQIRVAHQHTSSTLNSFESALSYMRVVSPSPHWGAYVAEHNAHASGDHVRIMQHARSSACAHLGIHITRLHTGQGRV